MVRLSLYEISQQILLRISPLNYYFSEIRNSNSFQYILLFNLLGILKKLEEKMNLLLKSQNSKAIFTLVASGIIVLALFSMKHNHLSMDVIDILNRAGIIAPSWLVSAITATGSVLAIITVLGSLGAGLPLAVLEQLAGASTAAA
ncbi:hypothetical protein P5660_06180 [Bacillus velezensis]|nr:hypothetical protein P5660_06180 [Bacillus velezensis]